MGALDSAHSIAVTVIMPTYETYCKCCPGGVIRFKVRRKTHDPHGLDGLRNATAECDQCGQTYSGNQLFTVEQMDGSEAVSKRKPKPKSKYETDQRMPRVYRIGRT
jgi:hypothetical protein